MKTNLEEFAERLQEEIQYGASKSDIIETLTKWQQEQEKKMYSEEEVLEFANYFGTATKENLKWFEQFKKK
jgi:hypothetical protein